nr:hypothetical protein [Tanacetum cinerariifolium]
MSNTNNIMQTHTSNALHNAIMEAGGKDHPPMLAPGNYVQWKSKIKRYIDTKPNHELIHYCLRNPPYEYKWNDKAIPVTEAIERLKQGESINVQDIETNLYWEFGKFTSRDGESLESYYSRFYKMTNELVRNQCDVTNHQVNVQFLLQLQPEWQRSQQATTRNKGKAIVNSPPPIYDQEPTMITEDDEMSKDKEIDKLMALISLSFKKIYKPTNNNLRTSSNTTRANQDNSLRISSGTGYDNQRIVNVAGARETVGTKVERQITSLESSNNHFKEENNELSKTNKLMYKDLKKFQVELDKYHDVKPQLKSNQIEDRVMLNNSQGKKQEVEDHRRNVKFSKNKTSVTACNDSLNAKTSNVNFVCVTCGKCVLNDNHDKCVLHCLNGVNSRTKMPMAMPISTREPKCKVNQSVATPVRSSVASESTNQKPRHTTRKLYESVSKTCSWWYPKFTPPGYTL